MASDTAPGSVPAAMVGPDTTSGPMRTCIGCRARRPDHELVRVAVADGTLVVNQRGIGRGAWMCRDESCMVLAGKTKAFSRAFRTKLADGVFADTLLGWLGNPAV